MKRYIHRLAGFLALSCILVFWTSTIFSEAFGDHEAIARTKTFILYGMIILIPSLMATAGSGFALAGPTPGRLARVKKARMPFIALNGLLILVPSALFLWWKASHGTFDTLFVIVQGAELIAGAVNITLISFNIRDGLRLSKRMRPVA